MMFGQMRSVALILVRHQQCDTLMVIVVATDATTCCTGEPNPAGWNKGTSLEGRPGQGSRPRSMEAWISEPNQCQAVRQRGPQPSNEAC